MLERPLDLLERRSLLDHTGHVTRIGRLHRFTQRDFGQSEAQQEGQKRDGHGDQEDDLHGVRQRVAVLGVEGDPRGGRLELCQGGGVERFGVERLQQPGGTLANVGAKVRVNTMV